MIERSRLKRWLSDPSLSEHLHSQLGFLDAYERLLDRGVADGAEINEVIRAGFEAFLSLAQSRRWDRPEVNDLMKAGMSAFLSLMQVQERVGGRLIDVQKDALGRYRGLIEEILAEQQEAGEATRTDVPAEEGEEGSAP